MAKYERLGLSKISSMTIKVHVVFNGLVRQFILYFTFINEYMLADVEKMYHKVLIRTENRKFQSILYRSDRSEDIRIRYSHLHYRVCIISSYMHIARNRNPMREKLRLLVGVDK